MNLKEDIKFLYEVGTLRYVDRTWKQTFGVPVANVTEHTFRVMWIAQIIAKHEWIEDLWKIAQLALVHDISEIRSVDTEYISRQYTTRHEEEAVRDTLGGTCLQDYYMALAEEVEARETIESKIVKDADTLDCDFEIREMLYKWAKICEYWTEQRRDYVKEKMYTETAKKMFDEIIESNPHDRHIEGKNRFNSGDWKKKD